jgi:signal peptidase II
MKSAKYNWLWLLVVAAVVVAADQWTKAWVRSILPEMNSTWAPFPALEPYFKFTHLTNTGAAFGMLRGQGYLFVVIAMVVIVGVIAYSRHLPADRWAVRLCLGLMLGGALGNNLVDRLLRGEVTDFLLFTLPLKDRVLQYPAFNVADSCIVVGVIILAILMLAEDRASGAALQNAESSAASHVS